MIYLTPWKQHGHYSNLVWRRHNILGETAASAFYVGSGLYSCDYAGLDEIPFPEFTTIEEAMEACDQELIEHGYEFIDEERAEKLRLLL